MSESPFIAGAQVAVYSVRSWGLPIPVKKVVAKVHKNGNFVLEGTPEQWKPGKSWGRDRWQASRTGQSSYSQTCEIWAAEHDQMLVDAKNADRWFNACAAIDKASRRPPDDASLIDALEDVVRRMNLADATKETTP